MKAKKFWAHLFSTLVLSGISLAVLLISILTNYWVTSQVVYSSAYMPSEVNYGLFRGTLKRSPIQSPVYYDLEIVCVSDVNACMYSCQNNISDREKDIMLIIQNQTLPSCPIAANRKFEETAKRSRSSETFDIRQDRANHESGIDFILPGFWISTIIFLAIAIFFSGVSTFFSCVNVFFNPIEPIFSVLGLYIWNGLTTGFSLITIIIWVVLFMQTLSHNIAIADTLRNDLDEPHNSENLATFGYSFWLLLIATVLHLINIPILLHRRYLLARVPPPPIINVDQNDFTIMLY